MRCINEIIVPTPSPQRSGGAQRVRAVFAVVMLALLAGCAIPVAETPSAKSALTPPKPAPKPALVEPVVSAEARHQYEQALAALKAGRYVEAERALVALTLREPNLAGPHGNLGILYARTGKPTQAIESLRQAIRLNPDRAAYYNELGLVFRREGKFDEARRQYDKALEVDPDYANAHLNLGIVLDLYLHDPERALAHYQRYRELAPREATTVNKWIADLQQRNRKGTQAKQEKG
jgi:tetratricopeptide (TPR) repeat protein